MNVITVFTPTFNRAYTLIHCYKSLVNQNNQLFEWLIVDDGSNDETKILVKEWIVEGLIPIRYIYQENRGMLAAHNTAHQNINTELTMCLDSDDYLPENTINKILHIWSRYSVIPDLAGIVGLDAFKDGSIIGESFPSDLKYAKFKDTIHYKGDKKFIYRTQLLKEYGPYPTIEGEKFPAQGYLYRKIDEKFRLAVSNEVFCIVEYLPDGNTNNKFSSYFKNPRSFAAHRLLCMKTADSFFERFKQAIHFDSSCIIANEYIKIVTNPYRGTTILAFPFGMILYAYLKLSINKKRIKTAHEK